MGRATEVQCLMASSFMAMSGNGGANTPGGGGSPGILSTADRLTEGEERRGATMNRVALIEITLTQHIIWWVVGDDRRM